MKKVLKKLFIVFIIVSCFVMPVYAATCNKCSFTGSKGMNLHEYRSAGWTAYHDCAKSIFISCKVNNGTMYTSQGHSDKKNFGRTYSNTTVVSGSMTANAGGGSYSITSNKCDPCSHGCNDCSD